MGYLKKWSVRSFIYISICAAAIAAGVAAGGFWPGDEGALAAGYPGSVIRFHVIANSDSPADQALKLKVRDAVVRSMTPVLADVRDIGEARTRVDDNLDLIRAAATRVLWENGCSQPVKVMRGSYEFPQKTYRISGDGGETADLTLPAGEYEAVRVIIGSGKGANWWCVLFPPLCFVNPVEEKPPAGPGKEREKSPAEIPAFKQDRIAPEKAEAVPAVEYRLKMVELFREWVKH